MMLTPDYKQIGSGLPLVLFLSSNRDQTAGFVLLIEPMGDGKNGAVRRSFLQGFHHQGFCAAA